MQKGGHTTSNVNQRTASIIHFAGFLIPIVLVLYGLLVQMNGTDTRHPMGGVMLILLTFGWIGLGIYQLLVVSRSRTESAIRLVAYHILTIIYVLFVSGFAMPFICSWIVLFLASYEYFSRRGLALSVATFFLVAITDALLNISDEQYTITTIAAFVATFMLGVITVMISQAQAVDRRELDNAKNEGILQRDRIVTLVNNLADAILSTDTEGVIQIYNAASLGLLDTNAELVGTSVDDIVKLIDPNNKPFRLAHALRQAKSVVSRDDLRATISDETLNLSVVYSPIRSADSSSGHTDGYIVILRDITKQKSLEEERDEFISVVSHELRTPITIAEGTLSNVDLMMSRSDIPKTTLHNNVSIAHEQVVFLAKMVNDLSTLSRAERGVADEPEDIDIKELIHDLYNEYAPQAEAKSLRFNLDLSSHLGSIHASRLYLKELLQNFVTNAIKYTKEGEVTVSVKKSGDNLEFIVRDSGIGISRTDQKRIFEKFFRSEDYRTRETGGTGLGLYVARKLSRKLGTEIRLTSRLNHGSTFGFSLPAEKQSKK